MSPDQEFELRRIPPRQAGHRGRTFTVLNLFIGIIVDAMQSRHAAERQAQADAREALDRQGADDRAAIL